MYSNPSAPSRTTRIWLTMFCFLNACKASNSSFGLSSTSRISTPLFTMKVSSFESEGKCRAVVQHRFAPNSASVAMDDSLHDGQTYPGPLVICGAVQSLKDAEQFADVLHVESGAVVF